MIRLTDEEIPYKISWQNEADTNRAMGYKEGAKAQLKKVVDNLYRKSIWARVNGETGRFITESTWQSLLSEIE